MGWYDAHVLPRAIDLLLSNPRALDIRRRVTAGLAGDVLEIGFGSGLNLPYLPSTVTSVKAVDPSGTAVRIARSRIDDCPVPVEIIGLDGQLLPLPDASVDAVLSTWTLCTIPDAVAAVREVRRVLRPGGALHFVEHGLAESPGLQRWQHRLDPIQQRIAGGCHLDREITAILADGGLAIRELNRYFGAGMPKPLGALYEGIAVAS
ncbi:MAG TPA: class I SAM-dependent methyltransferase [Mycobacteriales bacterium]|jgi:SAM-dependent methyltransferase|nr:class I SAM-dependent methyltransferase [Mycobacteriales bacterium]